MDWSKTLNLPRTEFPMRANLPQKEPEILEFWDKINLYGLVQRKTAGRPKFILHDGPPYANGHIHLGHALNKILKDIIVKYHSMNGFDAPYVPGWDTHGLPIEQQAIKTLGINRHAMDPVEFRRHCKDYALRFVDIQRDEFKRPTLILRSCRSTRHGRSKFLAKWPRRVTSIKASGPYTGVQLVKRLSPKPR